MFAVTDSDPFAFWVRKLGPESRNPGADGQSWGAGSLREAGLTRPRRAGGFRMFLSLSTGARGVGRAGGYFCCRVLFRPGKEAQSRHTEAEQ